MIASRVPVQAGEAGPSESEVELRELAASLKDTQPIGALVALARTIDQVGRVCVCVCVCV